MGSLSDYSEKEWLDHICNAAYPPVATVYLALATADPTDAGTGASMSECANANGYTRKAITFGAAASRTITQSGVVTFDQASGSWGTVSHWAVVDNSGYGLGAMLAHGAFAVGKAIENGNTPSVPTTEVYVSMDANEFSTYVVDKLLDLMFRNQAYGIPDTWVALADTILADGDTDITAKEVSGGSYARKEVDINGGTPPTWTVAAGDTPTEIDNVAAITFVTATASWGTVVAVGICDAVTVGNLLLYDNTMADQLVGDGDTVEFAIGALDIQLT